MKILNCHAGGFTLNGQYNATIKKRKMTGFCSSHKVALVVSTFSLLVTIGLVITLLFMKGTFYFLNPVIIQLLS